MTGLSMLGAGPVKDLTSLLLSLCQMLRGLRTLPWPGTETQMGSSTHVISQGPQAEGPETSLGGSEAPP